MLWVLQLRLRQRRLLQLRLPPVVVAAMRLSIFVHALVCCDERDADALRMIVRATMNVGAFVVVVGETATTMTAKKPTTTTTNVNSVSNHHQ